jgi:hypothetical protein
VEQAIVFRGLLSPASAQAQTTENDRPRHVWVSGSYLVAEVHVAAPLKTLSPRDA